VPEDAAVGAIVEVRFGNARRRGVVTELDVVPPEGVRTSAIERVAETQEELRGELALLAERFDGLERTLRKLAAEQSSGRSEVERRQNEALESLAGERRQRERMLALSILLAVILSIAALVLSLVST
jgi:primosomal protein N'